VTFENFYTTLKKVSRFVHELKKVSTKAKINLLCDNTVELTFENVYLTLE